MIEVTLQQLSMTYPPNVHALQNVDLTIAAGETLALVGPTGSGKSTTLRLIAGLDQPTSGNILFNGQSALRVPPRKRNLAMVFQRPVLLPHLTVHDNLAFGLRLQHPKVSGNEIQKRVQEMIEMLDLENLLTRRPHQLSGGQKQRVALGRALARHAPLILFDEPFSHLDLPLRFEMQQRLILLQRRLHATMIVVTHDPWEAITLAERIAVLENGEIQQLASASEIQKHPVSKTVAELFHDPLLTRIPGSLKSSANGWFLDAPVGSLPLPTDRDWVPRDGQSVIAGFPAGSVSLSSERQSNLQGKVIAIHPWTFPWIQVVIRCGEAELAVVLEENSTSLQTGDLAHLTLNVDRAFWLDAITGRSLEADITSLTR